MCDNISTSNVEVRFFLLERASAEQEYHKGNRDIVQGTGISKGEQGYHKGSRDLVQGTGGWVTVSNENTSIVREAGG